MQRMIARWLWPLSIFGISGVIGLAIPVTQGAAQEQATEPGALQGMLESGQERTFYADKLKTLGYRITSVNYDDSDYLEYEVVKGDHAYEVQIDIDPATNTTAAVTVTDDWWQTASTERVLEQKTPSTRTDSTVEETGTPEHRYSDRDRTTRMVRRLDALPTGKDKRFYRNTLKKQGYTITTINTNSLEELDLEAIKNGKGIALTVQFDKDSGKSTAVEAAPLWWASTATQAALGDTDLSAWEREQAQLQRKLKPGHTRRFYASTLRDMGYQLTSINYQDFTYLEYEVVKGDHTYEIQIDIDRDSEEATNVTVTNNWWPADTTQRALEEGKQWADRTADTTRSSSDRQRTAKMKKELSALPLGKNKQFYRQALKDQGYTVTKVNADSPEEFDVVAQKDGKRIALLVDFDEETGQSTDIEALRVRRAAKSAKSETQNTAKDAVKDAGEKPQVKQDAAAPAQPLAKDAGQEEPPQAKQDKLTLRQLVEELRSLPIGKDKDFYHQTLKERGYSIANTQDNQHQTEFTLEKAEQTLRLTVQFDANTGTSTKVDASGPRLAG